MEENTKTLIRDKKIIEFLSKLYPKNKKKIFFQSNNFKKQICEMIKISAISILLSLKKDQILKGINEIKRKYTKILKFFDKLICIIL